MSDSLLNLSLPKTQKVVVCPGPGKPWNILDDFPVPTPGPQDVLIKVIAVGLCGGDGVLRTGGMPGLSYPVVAGHEIVGRVVALGNEVEQSSGTSIWKWSIGQRVGVGWNAGRCQKCYYCTTGNPQGCGMAHATALTRDGGLAEYMAAHFTALVPYPDELSPLQAPLLCAGLTCFNSLRHTRAKPGDSVLIIGCGGLGHVAIPLARAMGLRPMVVSRTEGKRRYATELGAEAFIDSQAWPVTQGESEDTLAKEIIRIVDSPFGGSGPGGVNIVLQTAPEEETLRRVTAALAMDAEIILLSEPDSMKIDLPLMPFLIKRASIRGWTAGVPTDAHDTLRFCVQSGVRCIVETTTMENAEAAYTNMSNALFRTVVVVDPSQV
ncbi:Alcohol dehydrogenase 2 OS=Candida albicans (strain SC5314 / ATCC MYA-2876) GN=ADH2 PE=1 SV=1 [Rhizoctonia solani AG-1 IB]|uniref:Alcohol dehydrogenase 2 n=1 Tax=Thanatephorus cucumeris (strain AG1-IB / isolate 7/3/14) TaxID=1108050 RepID=A0A0B7FNW6_THACB|nr:Alcohol dehydrogenase 2 OS=Candida albicans (strain SC5314 / ATCC MYA-2876) GN=ADH2 PE=1 SV=1 [Rhizoctonia solani AG-1 IB]